MLTMPLFFAGSAIYPLELMPDWLKIVARVNPLTYLADALRGVMIHGSPNLHSYALDFGIMTIVFVVLLGIAAKLYPTLVQ
jgi:ABC-2 type transport system permease protein